MFSTEWRLLSGTEAITGGVLFANCQTDRPASGGQRQIALALEEPACVHLRRRDRVHARYSTEPTSLSPGAAAEAGLGISPDADCGRLLPGLRRSARCGNVSLCRQGP